MTIEQVGHGVPPTSLPSPRPRVNAPSHPLADANGQVPVEVFEVPPELIDAIRTLPIRPPVEVTVVAALAAPVRGDGPRPAPSLPVAAPVPLRLAGEARRGTRFDAEV